MKIEGKEQKQKNETSIIINHEEGKNFEGIIKNLQKKFGPNLHEQGIISITASAPDRSCFNKPEQVIDYNWNNNWCSPNTPNNWLEINFKQQKVKINGYSLKTYKYSLCANHLKNWVIEGSNDQNQWIEIDRKENNFDFNGSNYQHYFPITKSENVFQYIRIRNIGKTHNDQYWLVLTNIEFYGEIFNNDQ